MRGQALSFLCSLDTLEQGLGIDFGLSVHSSKDNLTAHNLRGGT